MFFRVRGCVRRQKGPEPEHEREESYAAPCAVGKSRRCRRGQLCGLPGVWEARKASRHSARKIDVRPGGVEGRGNATPRAAVHETRPASVRPGEQARPTFRPTRHTRFDRPTKPTRMSSLTRIYTLRDQSTRNSWWRRYVRPFRNVSKASLSFPFPGVLENHAR